MCARAEAHACIFVLEFLSFFLSLSLFLSRFFFLFSLFIVVNPKSTFYISRRVYSKRIFFRQIDALKKCAEYTRRVSTVHDSWAYCEITLVWLAARMHACVRAKITGHESL